MQRFIFKTYDKMSKEAADIIIKEVNKKPNTILGLATGSTPVGMYNELVQAYKKGSVDFSKLITFNLDEYYKISKENEQSYHYYMYHHLFSHINVKEQNVHIPNGNVDDVDAECKQYNDLIQQCGGIDLQVLGIGSNGHIGFNEPATVLNANTHLTALKQTTIADNARFFENDEQVPKHAITMGLGSILKAKKILLLINGKNKAEIAKKIFEQKITTSIPASLVQLHPDVTVLMDEEAAT